MKSATILKSASCGVGFICNIRKTRSRDIIRWGIEAVKNLTHRGAVGADGKTGDGAGVLFQLPKNFFLKEIQKSGLSISHIDNLAVGFFFLREGLEGEIEKTIKKFGLKVVAWRDVPTNDDALGQSALSAKPCIRQLLIDAAGIEKGKREFNLFLARRVIEKTLGSRVYVVSLSSKTIIYKGMLVATNLDRFYPDLLDSDLESAFCMFHQRFSTNTLPDWSLAQPFRTLGHNGEINTIHGNRNWMVSMEHEIRHQFSDPDSETITPLISFDESDSASLDRIVELLTLSGFPPEHAITMCVPPALECCDFTEEERGNIEAFFEYQSLLMKPWDGPAALVFTDGDTIGAHLDRNGLRPLRYLITEDGILLLGSEAGMVDLGKRPIMAKGRLGPGETLSVDTINGNVRFTQEILRELSSQKPYREWIDSNLMRLRTEPKQNSDSIPEITRKQIAFGYTSEEIQTSLREMARSGKEMTYSMGDDTALPPLSEKPQLLFRYFRQRFSQVTNPPIDHIREKLVMSLRMNLGHKMSFLTETPQHARRLSLDSPILLGDDMAAIEQQTVLKTDRIPITFPIDDGVAPLSNAVKTLQQRVISSVKSGGTLIILSDRDISGKMAAIPALLAVSACFRALRSEGISNKASLILETGEARDIHHMACLISYNASAVYPYLAFHTIKELCDRNVVTLPYEKAVMNYKKALENGLLKVIAKMGISTLNSYYGAELFDTVCLNRDFVEEYFRGTPVSIESDGLPEIEHSLLQRHAAAFATPEPSLDYGGNIRYRKGGEWHAWSPSLVVAFKDFIRNKNYNSYKEFSRIANDRPALIKNLLHYRKGNPVPFEEIEPIEHIRSRFFSGAMSVGALSPEAHETIAAACNMLGMRSNSGEGGEDPVRYWSTKNSAIKQIASGRFGVTPTYLASADEMEIKIAQGAKPGEGGHLPAIKVTDYIAGLRHCHKGIILISPPPHHDIYSIEDLAQLINDLKEANPKAKVCVKLVSEIGVGTVAAGVAKAYADIIQISGSEGGTGAASISSIKNAGNYWEIGLAETQRVLMENGLRGSIRLRVDGGFRTGRDVIIAALLGAEEYGFGTATMVATGCVMARQCHLNTCPTGVATQDSKLRERFKGRVEDVTAYFNAVAREVRELLGEMGFSSLEEIIGRADLLTFALSENFPAERKIVLDRFFSPYPEGTEKIRIKERNDNPAQSMNDMLVRELLPFIEKREPVQKTYEIRNVNRSVPAKLNYHIALRYRDEGLPADTVRLIFRGTAGQSFGAFNHKGLSLTLFGEANDYVGKGMFGGKIIIRPGHTGYCRDCVVMGNTALYGATGGEFYAAGKAGERFAVRNSGVTAVVEGTGHHLCEYMTRGTVVVIGETGYNIGAGMTGGIIYIYDEHDKLNDRLNGSYVTATGLDEKDATSIKSLLEHHYSCTESHRAGAILEHFDAALKRFKKITPVNNSSPS